MLPSLIQIELAIAQRSDLQARAATRRQSRPYEPENATTVHAPPNKRGRMRKVFAAAALLTVAVFALTSAAQAANPGRANVLSCEFTVHVAFEESSALAKRMSLETDAPSTVDCLGRADQQVITGTGPIAMRATFVAGALCATRSGAGSLEMSVPRFLPIFTTPMERLAGTFTVFAVDRAWSWRGSVTDERGERTAFSAAARFTPDASQGCSGRSGTLAGRLAIGA